MYLDARLFDTPKSKFTYFKGMMFVAAVSATIVYFMGGGTSGGMGGGGGGGGNSRYGGGGGGSVPYGTATVHGLDQEIFTGVTPF